MKRWMLAALLFLAFAPAFAVADALSLYVSPEGSDANLGTREAPLQTIAAALDRARGVTDIEGTVIWLADGTYAPQAPLTIDARTTRPVSLRALPGQTPVLSGAVPLSGWQETTHFGRTVFLLSVTADALQALYGPQGALQSARWPKMGMLTVAKVDPADGINPDEDTQVHFRAFTADPGYLPTLLTGARLRLFHGWKDELTGVRLYDATTGRVTLNRRTSMTVEAGDLFYFENVLTAPMEPGEWAFDAAMGRLYYCPKPGETPENVALSAGWLETLLQIGGADNLTFEGITFTHTGWSIPLGDRTADFPQAAIHASSAVTVSNARHVTFTDCHFLELGAAAIRVDRAVTDFTLTDSAFENIGAQALHVQGRNGTGGGAQIQGLVIQGNVIRGYGRTFRNAPALLVRFARDVEICYNEITDGYYTAISGGWVWGDASQYTDNLQILYNRIDDIGHGLLSDMGGIYLLGTQKNTVVAGNVITGVTAGEYGGWGIYLDEGAKGITIRENVVVGCSSQGLFQHRGGDNTATNNIFAYNALGQVGMSDSRASARAGTLTLTHNILAGDAHLYRESGTETIRSTDNLTLTDRAIFYDAEAGDFRLVPGCLRMATEIGFTAFALQAGRGEGTEGGNDQRGIAPLDSPSSPHGGERDKGELL